MKNLTISVWAKHGNAMRLNILNRVYGSIRDTELLHDTLHDDLDNVSLLTVIIWSNIEEKLAKIRIQDESN